MNAASPLRLRRVRFKNGNTIEVLKCGNTDAPDRFRRITDNILNYPSQIAGYALVAWHADGAVLADYRNGAFSPLTSGQIPQYAKDCLLTEMAVRWNKD